MNAPERVRVTAPVTGRIRRTTIASEIDAQTGVGEIYMRQLTRSQLRLGIIVGGILLIMVGLLPVILTRIAWLRTAQVAGIPVSWLIIGVGCYPVIIALGLIYVRRAERTEREFSDLAAPPSDTDDLAGPARDGR